jgi:hypothetical protein
MEMLFLLMIIADLRSLPLIRDILAALTNCRRLSNLFHLHFNLASRVGQARHDGNISNHLHGRSNVNGDVRG